jgi:hypothetical protein
VDACLPIKVINARRGGNQPDRVIAAASREPSGRDEERRPERKTRWTLRTPGISAEAHDMTTFTAWKFDDPQGAERAVRMLEDAQANGPYKIDDHAIVSWPADAAQPNRRVAARPARLPAIARPARP